MIIGFLGKGGSGKSTLCYGTAKFLEARGSTVLAIDADHNMDLMYDFGADELPFLGAALPDLKRHIGLFPSTHYLEAFGDGAIQDFRLSPPDAFTESYSKILSPRMRLMAAGPHTEDVLHDKSCSHSLITSLKIYLPYLHLDKNEYVVIDETAGTDSVGTGITTGFDAAVIVLEPALHSIKAAKQISSMLQLYGTPHIFVANKMKSDKDMQHVEQLLGRKPDAIFSFKGSLSSLEAAGPEDAFAKMIRKLAEIKSPSSRLARTRARHAENIHYKEEHS